MRFAALALLLALAGGAHAQDAAQPQGQPATAHWGYPDPSDVQGTPEQQREAFRHTMLAIKRRLELLIALPPEKLARTMLQDSARALAQAG